MKLKPESRFPLLIGLCAVFALRAGAECNCVMDQFEATYTVGNSSGQTIYGSEDSIRIPAKPCTQITVKLRGLVNCTWFDNGNRNTERIVETPYTEFTVLNQGYDKPLEKRDILLSTNCVRHSKDVSKNVTVFFDQEPSGDSNPNQPQPELNSLHWHVSLGHSSSGRSAGRIRLESNTLSERLLHPESLRVEGLGIRDIVYRLPASSGGPRQILCDEYFADIVCTNQTGYEIRFYHPDQLTGKTNEYSLWDGYLRAWIPIGESVQGIEWRAETRVFTNQVYTIRPGTEPLVRHWIGNPAGTNAFSRLRIETRHDGPDFTYVEFSCPDGLWTLSENGTRTTTLSVEPRNGQTIKTWRVFDDDGNESVTKKTYVELDGRQAPIRTEIGTGQGLRATTQVFYNNEADKARYGRLRRRDGPDGDWEEYEYDDLGRISRTRSWQPSLGQVKTIVSEYGPLFSSENLPIGVPYDSGENEKGTARSETVYIGDVPIKKTLHSITYDTLGYSRAETVRLLDPTVTDNLAAWTDPANPHSLAIYMPENYGMPCSKLPWLVVNPDGTATSYDYISGDYVPGEDGTPGTFTRVQGGPYFRTIATHGTAESFGIDSMGCSTNYVGIPLRTTRDVKIELRTGKREVLRETQVCNAAGAYETVSWTTTTLDDLGHVVATRSSDGSRMENEWLGDRLIASTGADGIRTTYAYDGLGRRISSTYTDPLTGAEVVSSTTYDAAGRVLASTTTAGGLSQSTQRRYDSAGRLVWSRGPDGIETTTSYGTTNGLRFVATMRGAGGLFTTSTTYSYADGQTAYVERNGKRAETYEYGYADGLRWTIAYEGPKGTNSPVWAASVSDALGRTVRKLRPGFGSSILETATAYNAAGQLLSTEEYTHQPSAELAALLTLPPRTPRENETLRSRTLYAYDSLGDLRVSMQDVNLSGTIDLAGPDVVSSNETAFALLDSAWWLESSRYSFPDSDSAEPLRVSTTRTRLSGLGVPEATELGIVILSSETRSIDVLGNISSQKSYRNRADHRAFDLSTSAASALAAWSLSIGGHTVSNRTATGILSSRDYDALGRVIAMTDGRGNTTTLAYDAAGRLVSTTDATGATTAYGYDSLGRQTSVTNAIGLVTTTSYDPDNNITAQGGAQYPVWYSYDDYGRMRNMTTFRTEDLASGDVTTWHYDEATGLLVFKEYADGKGPTYDYTPEGKLSRRTWARGVTTDYAYDGQGRLISKNYSDSTPDVSLTYDRLGHTLSAVCDGVSTNLYAYNRIGQLTNEVQNGTTIARSYDALGRATGYTIGDGIAAGSGVSYSYDTLGRFASVTSGTNVFSYSYLTESDLVSGMAANTGHAWERTYESDRNLIATVHNRFGNRTISRFDYTNDEIGRRVARVDSGEAFAETAFERYAYNDRSEVIGSQRFYGTDISDLSRPVTGRTFGYGYDPSGNRVSSFEDAGGERLTTTYTANGLNQYTAIQNPGAVPLRGDAKRNAVVTINGDCVERDNGTASFTPWSYSLSPDGPTAHYQNADVLAVAQNATGEDVEQCESGSVFAPAAETLLTYDDDGNMTFDGRFRYSWNGENRMIRAEEAVAPTNRAPTVITYAYDEQGRMVAKNIARTNSIARSLLWDGYNIVHETDNGVSTYNVWGIDLDGTLQGCGGVGGLLAVAKTNGLHIALYDANGNVSEYVSASSIISAHYEYSPFGEPIVSNGEIFMHQFSSKPFCFITRLSGYQFRNLDVAKGRWINRDPIFEQGGNNLYLFCLNIREWMDLFGLASISWGNSTIETPVHDNNTDLLISLLFVSENENDPSLPHDCSGYRNCIFDCHWVRKTASFISGSGTWTLMKHKLGDPEHARALWVNILDGFDDSWIHKYELVSAPTAAKNLAVTGRDSASLSIETRFFMPTWFEFNGVKGQGKTDSDAIRESVADFCICKLTDYAKTLFPFVFW